MILLILGESWASFGRGLGRSWAALGRLLPVFWTFEDELFSSIGTRWGLRGLLDGCGVDSRRDLEGFGGDLGRFGEKIWDGFGPSQRRVGRSWKCLVSFGPAGEDSQLGPPRWSAKRHNARGSSPQRGESRTRVLFLSFPS